MGEFSNIEYSKINRNTKTVYYQMEHNLVLPGGRSIENIMPGVIDSIYGDGTKYLVRIVDLNEYDKYDYIFEYSMPNIENIRRSGLFSQTFMDKILYFPPVPFNFIDYTPYRTLDVLTTFLYTWTQPRRAEMFKRLSENLSTCGISYNNVSNANLEKLRETYDNTKILLNIHQTDHHHTLEELRILPALCRGVVVVSENVPLRETVPYHQFIVWCNYDNAIETVRNVLANYEQHHNNIMQNFKKVLDDFNGKAIDIIRSKLGESEP